MSYPQLQRGVASQCYFRGGERPHAIFAAQQPDPDGLWRWMDVLRDKGGQPRHSAQQQWLNGMMFAFNDWVETLLTGLWKCFYAQ